MDQSAVIVVVWCGWRVMPAVWICPRYRNDAAVRGRGGEVAVEPLRWTEGTADEPSCVESCDLILGADVVYYPKVWPGRKLPKSLGVCFVVSG